MSKTRWLTVGLICSLVALPAIAQTQTQTQTQPQTQAQDTTNFLRELLHGLLGPNWNVFADGGVTIGERFLLQQAVNPAAGQRSLQTATGWNAGGGVGVDALLHLGVRLSYTFTSSQMNFRTDNGDNSSALDINNVARLKANTVSLEALHYTLTTRAPVSPYGGLGVQFTWWSLNEKSSLVTSSGAGHPLSISPVATFGLQARAADHWSGRIEAVMTGGKNPFTGKKSFRAAGGPTIDEPSGVSQTAFRLAAVYHFGSTKLKIPTSRRSR